MTISTEQRQRFEKIQVELDARGMRSVSLTLKEGLQAQDQDVIASDVADFFEAYLAGRVTPVALIGDEPQ